MSLKSENDLVDSKMQMKLIIQKILIANNKPDWNNWPGKRIEQLEKLI